MKEIKAFIRPQKAEEVISELELNGVRGLTVIDVSLLGTWADPHKSRLSMEYCEKYCSSAKIELICEDDELDKFLEIIINKAHTGQKGDGKIFVTEVYDAINIKTKEHGSNAL